MVDGRVKRGEATCERLIAAARALFGQRGYEGTSIEAVLKATGVTRGALYHHFATKEALFDAVLDQVAAEVATRAAVAGRGEDDPLASLRAGTSAWLQMACDPAIQRIVLLDAPAVLGWPRLRELDEQHTLGGLRAALRKLPADNRVPADQVDLLAHMVLASVNEAALMIAQADDPAAALDEGQAAVDTLLQRLVGVAVDAATGPGETVSDGIP